LAFILYSACAAVNHADDLALKLQTLRHSFPSKSAADTWTDAFFHVRSDIDGIVHYCKERPVGFYLLGFLLLSPAFIVTLASLIGSGLTAAFAAFSPALNNVKDV
jgi:hypothetical protein